MKNLILALATLGVVGFSLAACGDSTKGDEKNDCEKYAELAEEAMDAACAPMDVSCCICKCWKEGKDYDTQAVDCTCVDFTPPAEICEGTLLEEAQDCLADETACKSDITNMITMACPQS